VDRHWPLLWGAQGDNQEYGMWPGSALLSMGGSPDQGATRPCATGKSKALTCTDFSYRLDELAPAQGVMKDEAAWIVSRD